MCAALLGQLRLVRHNVWHYCYTYQPQWGAEAPRRTDYAVQCNEERRQIGFLVHMYTIAPLFAAGIGRKTPRAIHGLRSVCATPDSLVYPPLCSLHPNVTHVLAVNTYRLQTSIL